MNFKEFAAHFKDLSSRGPVDVEFTPGVLDLECYPEPKMRATLISVVDSHHDDDVMKIRVSYEKFDEYNKAFESHNYFGDARLGQDTRAASYSARECGWYQVKEDLYVMATDDISKFFTTIDGEASDLYAAYQSNPNGKTYVRWLEDLVREHAKAM